MLVTLFLWSYIFLINVIIGFFSLKRIYRFVGEKRDVNLAPAFIAGTLILTVYAEFISIIYKLSMWAHILVVTMAVVMLVIDSKEIASLIKRYTKGIVSWEGMFYIVIILICAFFTSRGTQHADTSLYHAQVIHWLEEYGTVKGLGNLMNNFAYNSSVLYFTALFSMKWLTGISFHVTNGLLMLVLTVVAIKGLLDWHDHSSHMADAARIAILFYDMVACVVIMSPATDQPANFLVIYLVLRWLENIEDNSSEHIFALICVASVYAMSIKLSAGLIVLLVISPLITLIKKKEVKQIVFYLCAGIVIIIPYFINYILLSGWILYPFPALDLLKVEWKIPIETVTLDANYISVYGKKIYEPDLADMPFMQWFKIWWSESEHYERQLLLASAVGFFIMGITFIKNLFRKEKINWNLILLNITLLICEIFWLVNAPFIRYSLGYLLVAPLVAISQIAGNEKKSCYRIIAVVSAVITITCLMPYWSHYVMDTLLYVKHNIKENYYIIPKDYDTLQCEEVEIDGRIYYKGTNGDMLSYYSFPGVTKTDFEMMGYDVKSGYKNVETK